MGSNKSLINTSNSPLFKNNNSSQEVYKASYQRALQMIEIRKLMDSNTPKENSPVKLEKYGDTSIDNEYMDNIDGNKISL